MCGNLFVSGLSGGQKGDLVIVIVIETIGGGAW